MVSPTLTEHLHVCGGHGGGLGGGQGGGQGEGHDGGQGEEHDGGQGVGYGHEGRYDDCAVCPDG